MNIIIGILTVLEVLAALLLIGLVLVQQTKSGGGLGAMGGGVTESVLGAGAGNFFTKATVIVASVFMGITLLLVILTAHRQQAKSVIESEPMPAKVKVEAKSAPPAGTVTAETVPAGVSATAAETTKPAVAEAKPATDKPVAAPAVTPAAVPAAAPVAAPATAPKGETPAVPVPAAGTAAGK